MIGLILGGLGLVAGVVLLYRFRRRVAVFGAEAFITFANFYERQKFSIYLSIDELNALQFLIKSELVSRLNAFLKQVASGGNSPIILNSIHDLILNFDETKYHILKHIKIAQKDILMKNIKFFVPGNVDQFIHVILTQGIVVNHIISEEFNVNPQKQVFQKWLIPYLPGLRVKFKVTETEIKDGKDKYDDLMRVINMLESGRSSVQQPTINPSDESIPYILDLSKKN